MTEGDRVFKRERKPDADGRRSLKTKESRATFSNGITFITRNTAQHPTRLKWSR